MGLETILGIASLVVSAVGTGLSVQSQNNAAKSQEELSLLNLQSQRQAAQQQGRLQSMQAQVNAALAAKDQAAANAAAVSLERQAQSVGAAGRENTRQQRMQFAQFIAQQRAAVAASGVVDTTGSPLALLADSAKQEQYAADETLYQVESAQRQLYFDADMQRNAGTVAGMQGLGFRAESAGAMGSIGMAEAQARLDYLGARAGATAMRNGATASLIGGIGDAFSGGYNLYRNTPRTSKVKAINNSLK